MYNTYTHDIQYIRDICMYVHTCTHDIQYIQAICIVCTYIHVLNRLFLLFTIFFVRPSYFLFLHFFFFFFFFLLLFLHRTCSPAMAPSSYRDRTAEFLSIADRSAKTHSSSASSSYSSSSSSYNSSSSSSYSSSSANDESATASLLQHADRSRSSDGVSIHSEFNKRASRIGLTIHQTSQKLSKLAKCEFLITFSISFSPSYVFLPDRLSFLLLDQIFAKSVLSLPKQTG